MQSPLTHTDFRNTRIETLHHVRMQKKGGRLCVSSKIHNTAGSTSMTEILHQQYHKKQWQEGQKSQPKYSTELLVDNGNDLYHTHVCL